MWLSESVLEVRLRLTTVRLFGKPLTEAGLEWLSESVLGVRWRLTDARALGSESTAEVESDCLPETKLDVRLRLAPRVQPLGRLLTGSETEKLLLSGLLEALHPTTVCESAVPLNIISQDPTRLGGLRSSRGRGSSDTESTSEWIEITEPTGVVVPEEAGLNRWSGGEIVVRYPATLVVCEETPQ